MSDQAGAPLTLPHCVCVLDFYRSIKTTCTPQTVSSTLSRRSCTRWALSTSTTWSWPPSTPPPRATPESECLHSLQAILLSRLYSFWQFNSWRQDAFWIIIFMSAWFSFYSTKFMTLNQTRLWFLPRPSVVKRNALTCSVMDTESLIEIADVV